MQGLSREAVKRRLARAWGRVAPRRVGDLVPIVCYHSVQALDRPHCVAPSAFEEQISYLATHFRLLPLSGLVDELTTGRLSGPAAAVTFDDGYGDNYTQAWPILAKYACPAAIFLVTGFLEGECQLIQERGFGPLRWEQVQEMWRTGVEFGAHGHTHRILGGLSAEAQRDEVVRCKTILEGRLGEQIDLFAYPNGQRCDFDHRTVQLLRAAGFRAACSTIWGTRSCPGSEYALGRVMIDGRDDMAVFRMKVHGAYDYLRYWQVWKPA